MVPSDSEGESLSDQDDTRSGNDSDKDSDDQIIGSEASKAHNARQLEHRAGSAERAECGASDAQRVEYRASSAEHAKCGTSDAQQVGHGPPAPVPASIISTPTRMGQRRKVRDMSGLSMCLCGDHAQAGNAGSIQCQRAGCETVWVSKFGWPW